MLSRSLFLIQSRTMATFSLDVTRIKIYNCRELYVQYVLILSSVFNAVYLQALELYIRQTQIYLYIYLFIFSLLCIILPVFFPVISFLHSSILPCPVTTLFFDQICITYNCCIEKFVINVFFFIFFNYFIGYVLRLNVLWNWVYL